MRILDLTPGTGSFHCGSCLRDNALIKALRARGHDAMMAPLYLPLVTDKEAANPEQPVRVGGVSLYLQQKFPWFRFVPRWVHRMLDRPALLRWASRRMDMTSARDLGEMTVGSLLGEKGRQWSEWERLVQWVGEECKPDAVLLSNSLLCGLAPALAGRLKLPVLCSLQGEDAFLDTLVEPYRSRAWELMHENAKSVTRFIAPSRFYAELMARRIGVEIAQMAVLPNGLDFSAFSQERSEPATPTVGYLARMIHGKGLTTLIDAFIILAKDGRVPGVRLRVAGAYTDSDRKYTDMLKERLRTAGLSDCVTWEPNLTYEGKLQFLRELTVFSVPATCGEAFGLYLIEAQAAGIPSVQPRHGAFPEIFAVTGGGILVQPDDPPALATGLEVLLNDPARRESLGAAALRTTRVEYSSAKMAERFEELLRTSV